MKEIKIVLRITDPEMLEAYGDIHEDLIFADLQNGSLLGECELVRIEKI